MSTVTTQEPLVARDRVQGALSGMRRPPAPSALSASLTMGWRALLKIKHVPFQLFDATIFPLTSTLLFTYLFGGALAGSPREYIQFLLPGILMQSVVFVTVYTGVGLNTDIDKGLFDRFRSLPIWQPAPLVGALLGDGLRYSLSGLLVIALGLALGFRPQAGAVGVLLALALVLVFAFAVSWIWVVVGLVAKRPESVMTWSFVLFPLTFLSNAFVDPATMPGWLQAVVAVNPVTHLVTATRALMHGEPASEAVAWVLVASAAITAIFAPIAFRLYGRER
jgi:ABC-2 type transport system permease protein